MCFLGVQAVLRNRLCFGKKDKSVDRTLVFDEGMTEIGGVNHGTTKNAAHKV